VKIVLTILTVLFWGSMAFYFIFYLPLYLVGAVLMIRWIWVRDIVDDARREHGSILVFRGIKEMRTRKRRPS